MGCGCDGHLLDLQMAEALARGFVSKGVASAENMFAFDPSEERKQVFKEFGCTPCATSKDVVKSGRLIFIAVKPQYVKTVLEEVKGELTDDHVIVSIAAGVPLSVLMVRLFHRSIDPGSAASHSERAA